MPESTQRAWRRLWDHLAARAVLLGVAVFGLSLTAVVLRPEGTHVAVWWPAAAVAVAVTVLSPRRHWLVLAAVVLVSSALANYVGGRTPVTALAFGVANAVEPLVAAGWLMQGRARPFRLRTVEDSVRLISAAALGALAAGTVAALTAGLLLPDSPWTVLRSITFAHTAAVLVATPVFLTVSSPHDPVHRRAEALAQWAAVTVVTGVVLLPAHSYPLSFLPLPFLVWGAVRLGSRHTTAQLLLFGLAVSLTSAQQRGPFVDVADGDLALSVSVAQFYLATYATMLVPLALAARQRREDLARLRSSEQLYRLTFDGSLVGMMMLRLDRAPASPRLLVVRTNETAAAVLDRRPEQLVGSELCRLVDERDRDLLYRAVTTVLETDDATWRGDVRLTTGTGLRWVEMAMARLADQEESVVTVQIVDVTEQRTSERRLRELALHDALTGLPNRTLLDDRVTRTLEDRRVGRGALLFCDLDDFKEVNDSAGHAAGDAVLVEVARRLLAVVRPGDTVCRLGGDEFVVFCPGAGVSEALPIAERVVAALSHPVEVAGTAHAVRVSVGLTDVAAGSTFDAALREADQAMYVSKAAGKGRVTTYQPVQT